MKITLVIPVYNDWMSLSTLLSRLTEALRDRTEQFHLIVVDDASDELPAGPLLDHAGPFSEGTLLRLNCNLGHQRAIAIGLAWLYHNGVCDAVVVMDSDGEDRPEDVPRLLDAFVASGGTAAVFAGRARRLEGLRFTFFYKLYQLGHRLLTGLPIRIGNFSILPGDFVRRLIVSSHLWNHYAATVVRQRLRLTTVPTVRGRRYQGHSKMNFVSLVRHGISAFAVHSELIAVRLLIATGAFSALALAVLVLCIIIRLFTSLAVPGWATYVTGLIVIILLQILSITFAFTIHAFANPTSMSFLPIRDYSWFIASSAGFAFDSGTRSRRHGTPSRADV